ncbi:MAG: polysaccharide biosynthesis/export family protein [Sporocytophaga sp.]|uniref:polysaccharide biosynthesis/export family protein n=1 Tax=Sporocytophaga sp. TaxID=2231183 RepID=UPI001B060E39|nr:polysaccharide biosynthesis/export family protein [Sporocytophaga sp.]MBO9699702.1 polysaccharide biosynthesis/export family protein [Sporocytophaga sp.]
MNKKFYLRFIYLFLLAISIFSCVPQKKVVYFQGKQNDSMFIEQEQFVYKIQPRDILHISIVSPDTRVTSFYNIQQTPSQTVTPGSIYLNGYLVSDSGFVNIPIIGKVRVKDQILSEIQSNIEKIVREQVSDATVVVKLLSYRVTVLGEVRNPGMHYMYNERFTLLEALGMAGDLSEYGSRKNIKLMRPKESGMEIVHLDLTDKDLLKSQYFYLKPNDVIYVAPMKAKIDRNNLVLVTTVFAGLSALFLIINFIKSN